MVVSLALFCLRVPADGFPMFLGIFFVASLMSGILNAFYGYGNENALTITNGH
jgi:hypothetical protein